MTRAILGHAVEPLLMIGVYATLSLVLHRFGDRLRRPDGIAADNPPVCWWGFPALMLAVVGVLYGGALLLEVVR